MYKVTALLVVMVGCGAPEVESTTEAILFCDGVACPSGWYCDPATQQCVSPVCRRCHDLPHAETDCVAVCELFCDAGWADCNHVTSDGCELATTTTANCGACGHACIVPPHASAECLGSTCGIGACDAGWEDCNGNPSDGCETAVVGSAQCMCANACAPLAHATVVCTAGACGLGTCATGWTDCNGNASDGCEANLATSTTNCGACGHVCAGGQICSAGVCKTKICGDGVCDPGENTTNCSVDCGCRPGTQDCCGDGICRVPKSCMLCQ